MKEELKRCPFCGSPAEYTSIDREFVRCSAGLKCPGEGQVYSIEDWNTRPVEDALFKSLAEIVDICERGGFISTDAKFLKIKETAKKAMNDILLSSLVQ